MVGRYRPSDEISEFRSSRERAGRPRGNQPWDDGHNTAPNNPDRAVKPAPVPADSRAHVRRQGGRFATWGLAPQVAGPALADKTPSGPRHHGAGICRRRLRSRQRLHATAGRPDHGERAPVACCYRRDCLRAPTRPSRAGRETVSAERATVGGVPTEAAVEARARRACGAACGLRRSV